MRFAIRVVDEPAAIPQSLPPMRRSKFIWLAWLLVAGRADAQPAPTNQTVRSLSLEEAVSLALEHNLNLKIERIKPEIAQFNVALAYAGGSVGVGRAGVLTVRGAGYDPEFFLEASKRYDSQPNVLTPVIRQQVQTLVNAEAGVQAVAARDEIRANEDIRMNAARLAQIDADQFANIITLAEADLRRSEQGVRLARAQTLSAEAQAVLTSAPDRTARAQSLQNFLNATPDGGAIPEGGLLDPNGTALFRTDITRTDALATGVRGSLPTGMSYELRLAAQHDNFPAFGSDSYSSVIGITASQPLLRNAWTDSTRTQIKASKKELKQTEWQLYFQIMDTVTRVQQAYYDLIFAEENVKVQEKALELANRLMDENKQRVKVGVLAPLDEQQAASQAALTRAALISAQNILTTQENTLKNLVTDDFASWQSVNLRPAEKLVAVAETFNLGESWAKGLTLRPDYNQQKVELELQEILLRFRQNQLWPSLDLVGSYQRNGLDPSSYGRSLSHTFQQNNPSYFVGAVFTLPLFNRDAKSRLKITKAFKEQAILGIKKLEQDIMMQIDNAVKFAQSTYQQVDATRQARVYSEAALDAEQKKLDNGKSTSFIVLDLQSKLTLARSAEIKALADYNKALAALYFSEGSTLERLRMQVEVK